MVPASANRTRSSGQRVLRRRSRPGRRDAVRRGAPPEPPSGLELAELAPHPAADVLAELEDPSSAIA